jgi:hypothetical protein
MIKPRPDLREENMRIYEIWRAKGMKREELGAIIEEFGSEELKAHRAAIKAEPEIEVGEGDPGCGHREVRRPQQAEA